MLFDLSHWCSFSFSTLGTPGSGGESTGEDLPDATSVSDDEVAIDVDINVDVQYTETQFQQHMDRLVLKESVRPNMILDNLRFKPV